MSPALPGGLQGIGEVISRHKPPDIRLYRGSFAFSAMDEEAIIELMASRRSVVYEGVVDGKSASLEVIVVGVSIESGIAI